MERVSIPEGSFGTARIQHFDVAAGGLEVFRLGARAPSPGRYTKLLIRGQLVMSDTPAEMRDHFSALHHARGDVLVNGLGLGMIANAIARKEGVASVTVVEINPDVIELVAPSLHPLVKVELADAFDYAPPKGARYGAVWHDIWPDLCTDNLPEMSRLKRRYSKRADWQGCWGEELLRVLKRRDDREERRRASW